MQKKSKKLFLLEVYLTLLTMQMETICPKEPFFFPKEAFTLSKILYYELHDSVEIKFTKVSVHWTEFSPNTST